VTLNECRVSLPAAAANTLHSCLIVVPHPCCTAVSLYCILQTVPQAAYRPWASLELPCPPLEQLPPLVVQLVQQGVRFATHSYPVSE
jgi:hypothetical protein